MIREGFAFLITFITAIVFFLVILITSRAFFRFNIPCFYNSFFICLLILIFLAFRYFSFVIKAFFIALIIIFSSFIFFLFNFFCLISISL
jgi:hypothetical protein